MERARTGGVPSPMEHLDGLRDGIVADLKDMIRIPTVNPPGTNYREFCEHAADRMRALNCDVDIVEVPVARSGDADHPRFSLVGRYRGSDWNRPGLHLSGHYDTVPAGKWSRDPLVPEEDDDRIYGLGASDMKGGLASIMGVVRALHETQTVLRDGLSFSFTPDEETGGEAGMGYLVESGHIEADVAILAEPSQPHFLRVGHKGALWLEIVSRGRTAAANVPHLGVNAFLKMVRVVNALEDLDATLAGRLTRSTVMTPPERRSTICIGTVVRGGLKTNMVPDECSIMIDRRLIPEESVPAARAEIQAILDRLAADDPELDVELVEHLAVEAAAIPTDSFLPTLVADVHERERGQRPAIGIVSGFNDSRFLIRGLGIPAITYGPGTTKTAHAPDEYVQVSDVMGAARVLLLSALELTGRRDPAA